ncbi:MAG: hypothetical protein AAFM92_10375 [Pseudomonadota bacterium]
MDWYVIAADMSALPVASAALEPLSDGTHRDLPVAWDNHLIRV